MTPKQLILLNDLKKRGLVDESALRPTENVDVEAILLEAIEKLVVEKERLSRNLSFYRSTVHWPDEWMDRPMEEAVGWHLSPLCDGCRFGEIKRDPLEYGYSSYNMYQCSLLDTEVYSKNPKCKIRDWVDKFEIPWPCNPDETMLALISKRRSAQITPAAHQTNNEPEPSEAP